MYEEEEVKRVSPKCFFRVVRGKDSRIGGSRMCAFFNFQGGFCNFPISISPRPSNETYETRAFAKQRRRSIAQIFSQQHIERSTLSFLKERLCKRTQPYLAFFRGGCKLSVAEMTRRKTGKKSIFRFFFFRTFLGRWCSKNYTTTLDPRENAHFSENASREGESTSEREDSGCLTAEEVSCSSSFVVKRERVENSFFLFEA